MYLRASLETAIGQASGFSLLANDNSQKIHVITSEIRNKEDSISRSSLNALFNENEKSVSFVGEKEVVGAVVLKEGTTVDISSGTNKGRMAIYKATNLKVENNRMKNLQENTLVNLAFKLNQRNHASYYPKDTVTFKISHSSNTITVHCNAGRTLEHFSLKVQLAYNI
ncbi:hypothetical protein pdam_00023304 [Pocillopora damicornis]|uniref:Uncharacterized protein n=1 Tax=Pocillopora damicornis TaxID=46731 RepID=A0A3M6TA36_POCDA|nr:hypothetical protein pdam_00023304 [Pocillopora damicornis]